jgi:insulysin
LLLLDKVEAEINAVDSEFNMGRQNEGKRAWMILQDVSHEDSYGSTFSCGNTDTLHVENIDKILKEYYETWYSSNIMKLVVYSNQEIE